MGLHSRRIVSTIAILSVAAAFVIAPETASAQCALCRRALDSPEGRQMIGALRSGILLLLAAPFVVFGTVAGLAIRMSRRSKQIS